MIARQKSPLCVNPAELGRRKFVKMSLRRVHTAADPTAALRSEWTPAQAAEFAARRDFLLLQQLSKDRRALAAARRCGFFRRSFWPRPEVVSSQQCDGTSERRAAQTQTARDTARQRRSRRRAAVHRAALAAAAAAKQPEKPDAQMSEAAPAPPAPPPAPPPAQQAQEQVVAERAEPAWRASDRQEGSTSTSDAFDDFPRPMTQAEINAIRMEKFLQRKRAMEALAPKSTDSTRGAKKMNL